MTESKDEFREAFSAMSSTIREARIADETNQHSRARLRNWGDPDYKIRMSKSQRKRWQNPEYLAEARVKANAAFKKKCDEDPEFRSVLRVAGRKGACVRLHGADCGCWQNDSADITRSKITVNEMRRLRDAGFSWNHIAEMAGVSYITIWRRVHGR